MAPATYVLVQADRRSALFAAIFLALGVTMAPRLLRRVAPSFVGFALIAPIVFGVFPTLLNSMGTFLRSIIILKRQGEAGEIGGRLGIWTKSINFYRDRVDGFHQIFGFGTYGQAQSGASSTYDQSFAGLARERILTTPHSSAIQLLLDGGWIVATGFVVAVLYATWMFSRRNSAADLAGLAMIAALSAVGFSEAVLAPSLGGSVWWTLVILVTIALSRESPATKRAITKNVRWGRGRVIHNERVTTGAPQLPT